MKYEMRSVARGSGLGKCRPDGLERDERRRALLKRLAPLTGKYEMGSA